MCGRINVYDHEGVRALLAQLGLGDWPKFEPRFNIPPTSKLDVLSFENGALKHQQMIWGLLPKWAQPGQFSSPLINARAESIHNKPSFKHLVKNQRILVPVNGFYEWARKEEHKPAFYISPKNSNAMFLAGIYQQVSEQLSECCLITTAANKDMLQIHHRMPVITSPENAMIWLEQSTDVELDELMQPQINGQLHMQMVSDFVNNARHEGPSCMHPAHNPQQQSLI